MILHDEPVHLAVPRAEHPVDRPHAGDITAIVAQVGTAIHQDDFILAQRSVVEMIMPIPGPLAPGRNHPIPQSAMALVAENVLSNRLQAVLHEQNTFAGQLGSQRSVRRQVYERIKRFLEQHQRRPTLFSRPYLERLPTILDTLLRFPLNEKTRPTLSQHIRLGASDEALAEHALRFADEDRLVVITDLEDTTPPDPQVVCSLGMIMM